MTDKKIAFSWYGGKFSHLDWLLPLLPQTNSYCEPFGGSAAVLLNREQSPLETYNDLDGEVVNFFRALRNQKEELLMVLELTPYSREEFVSAIPENKELSEVERARLFYLKIRMAFNSRTGALTKGDWGFSKYSSSGRLSKRCSAWLNSFEKLEQVATRLMQVQLENDYAIPVIERYDTEETLFYCDPPYPFESRTRDDQRYAHEMTEKEHIELWECLSKVRGLVALSGYRCELMDNLYGSWKRYDTPEMRLSASNSKTFKSESLWMNYDIEDFKQSQIKLL